MNIFTGRHRTYFTAELQSAFLSKSAIGRNDGKAEYD